MRRSRVAAGCNRVLLCYGYLWLFLLSLLFFSIRCQHTPSSFHLWGKLFDQSLENLLVLIRTNSSHRHIYEYHTIPHRSTLLVRSDHSRNYVYLQYFQGLFPSRYPKCLDFGMVKPQLILDIVHSLNTLIIFLTRW